MRSKIPLYRTLAEEIERHIKSRLFKEGDKLLSLRSFAKEKEISLTTARQVYFELEIKGLIIPRPQSGYQVVYKAKGLADTPSSSQPLTAKKQDNLIEIFSKVYDNKNLAKVYLSSSQLSARLVPVERLNKEIIRAVRHLPHGGVDYEIHGNAKLKRQIARKALSWNGNIREEDVIPTSGCFDAIALCLFYLLKPGDTIAVESPVHYGLTNFARIHGYKLLELPTNPVYGIEVEALTKVLQQRKVKVCLLMGNFSNPFGSLMPDEHKKAIVTLMEKYNVPLIEDDIYGDLYYSPSCPSFCKSYDESGIVLWCGSVSKTLAGGYRVGWLVPGKFKSQILQSQPYHPVNCNSVTHEAIGRFLENNRYENYLKNVRKTLYLNSRQFLRCIKEYFPADTKVTKPQGGIQLWVELNKRVDTLELYNKAMLNNISISPGVIYSAQQQFNNSFRLNYGMIWNNEVEDALKLLGKLVDKC
jgi:DNA-binding transcriptional MocR family regulator